MDYNKIFDIAYSTSISESLKDKILLELLELPVLESVEPVEPLVETYIQFLDTLIFSEISEDKMNSVIDEVFSTLDEEFINEVSAEFIKQKAQNSLINRQRAFDNAKQDYRAAKTGLKDSSKEFKAAKSNMKDGPIGLTSFKHYDDAQQKHDQAQTVHDTAKSNLDKATSRINRAKALANGATAKAKTSEAPKAEATSNIGSEIKANTETTNQAKTSPMDKLKSAAGKVKDWWNKNTKMNKTHDQVGLVHAIGKKAIENEKAGKEDIGFATINKNTEETPSAETSANETPVNKPKKTKTTGRGGKKKTTTETPAPETAINTETSSAETGSGEVKNVTKVENEGKPEGDKQQTSAAASKGKGRGGKKKTETPAPETSEVTTETPKGKGRGRKKTETPTAETTNNETPTPETPKGKGRGGKTNKETTAPSLSAAEKRELARQNQGYRKALDAKRERMNDIRNRSVQTDDDKEQLATLEKEIAELEQKLGSNAAVKEALTDLATLLAHTNISEGLFVNIMELAAPTRANVKKIENRYEKALGAAMDDLYKDVESRKPETPEKIKKVEEIGHRLDNLKRRRKMHFDS